MDDSGEVTHIGTTPYRKQPYRKIVWRNVILFSYLHLAALYGVLLIFTSAKIATTIFGMFNILNNIYIILLFSNIFV